MDSLRDLAFSNFQKYNKFRNQVDTTTHLAPHPVNPTQVSLRTVRFWAYPTIQPFHDYSSVLENDAASIGNSTPPVVQQEDPEASMAVLIVRRTDMETIWMSKENFQRVFTSFNIDPYALNLISSNWYGFHSTPMTYRGNYTFFIGTVMYVLVFSFNPTTMATNAICLVRDGDGLKTEDGEETIADFKAILHRYMSYIYSPHLLTFAAFVHLAQWLDEFYYHELVNIRESEMATGHGPFDQGGAIPTHSNIDSLIEMSEVTGRTQVTLANCTRHQGIATPLGDLLKAELESASPHYDIPDQFTEKLARYTSNLCEAMEILQRQVQGGVLSIKYLQERAGVQSAVIFALLTHMDAKINIDLASTNKELAEQSLHLAAKSSQIAQESALIAAAAKKDSSSMKTISIMTMAFLPGTFFAALFSVPLLNWNESVVVSDRFWVYWAFTLPFTALVFGLWLFCGGGVSSRKYSRRHYT